MTEYEEGRFGYAIMPHWQNMWTSSDDGLDEAAHGAVHVEPSRVIRLASMMGTARTMPRFAD